MEEEEVRREGGDKAIRTREELRRSGEGGTGKG